MKRESKLIMLSLSLDWELIMLNEEKYYYLWQIPSKKH